MNLYDRYNLSVGRKLPGEAFGLAGPVAIARADQERDQLVLYEMETNNPLFFPLHWTEQEKSIDVSASDLARALMRQGAAPSPEDVASRCKRYLALEEVSPLLAADMLATYPTSFSSMWAAAMPQLLEILSADEEGSLVTFEKAFAQTVFVRGTQRTLEDFSRLVSDPATTLANGVHFHTLTRAACEQLAADACRNGDLYEASQCLAPNSLLPPVDAADLEAVLKDTTWRSHVTALLQGQYIDNPYVLLEQPAVLHTALNLLSGDEHQWARALSSGVPLDLLVNAFQVPVRCPSVEWSVLESHPEAAMSFLLTKCPASALEAEPWPAVARPMLEAALLKERMTADLAGVSAAPRTKSARACAL